MDKLTFKILKKLYDNGAGKTTNVAAVFLEEYRDVDTSRHTAIQVANRRVEVLLVDLEETGLINPFQMPALGARNHSGEVAWFNNQAIDLSITNKGAQLIKEEIDRESNQRLQQSVIEVNESVVRTNNAAVENFKSQEKFAKRTWWIGLLSVLFISVTVVQTFMSNTDKNLQAIGDKVDSLTHELAKARSDMQKQAAAVSLTGSLNKIPGDSSIINK